MIKRILYLFCLLCIVLCANAQNYGNEWINYSQKYYRIPIAKTGLYRIDSLTLLNAGVPISAISPRNLQLFIKGSEQYIYIKGEADDVFNTADYLEFYAEKNDGRFDSLAYTNIAFLPNPYIAMWNDTNYAYITWNSSVSNRRVTLETDVNFAGYTASSYLYAEKVFAINAGYALGEKYIEDISDARYLKGEGYGYPVAKGQNIATSFGNLNVYQSPALSVYMRSNYSGTSKDYLGTIPYDHEILFEYQDNTGSMVTLQDTIFLGYGAFSTAAQTTSDKLGNSSFMRVTSVSNPAFGASTSGITVHFMYLKYPQQPNFMGNNEFTFFTDDNTSAAKAYLNIANVGGGSGQPLLYDLTNHRLIQTVYAGNLQALVPNSGGQKKCFFTNSSNATAVTSLTPVNQTGNFVNYLSGPADSAFVIVTHASLMSSAQSYKSYRQSVAGGSFNVILAEIGDLYDQFAYGNTKNPLAIRQFSRFLVNNAPSAPRYLLLLGKGIKHSDVRLSAANWNESLVPSMGWPASDLVFTTGINNTNSIVPYIPTGRLAATNNTEVGWYLNKITQHEALTPQAWRKHVLHFAGGYDQSQQNLFQNYLASYEQIITDTLYGGQVFNFRKTSTAPIQITVSDSVKQLIDGGTSLITFFGHGAVTGFDQAIDDPTLYNNAGKYFLLLANSCYSGDIHSTATNSASEKFIFIDQKGAIAFLASASLGVVYPLHAYSTEMYRSLAYYKYGKGVGDCVKNTCVANSLSLDPLVQLTMLEMTLHGDPSVKLLDYRRPDYEIQNSDVFFDTKSYVDSIGIGVAISNLGKAINDTFYVRVERYFPTGDSSTFFKKIKAPLYKDTLKFFMYKDFDRCVGLNRFRVMVDCYNQVAELSETNNATTGTVDLFIEGGDIVPVYPYKYAIIPKTPQVTLKASTSDPFAPQKNYRLQLDTNDTFLSPINSAIIQSTGGVVEWTVNLPFADSTVYFWRVTKDSVSPTESFNWRESSFQVIGTKSGWAQAHFHQFKNDNYQFIKYKKPQRKFDFANDVVALKCRNGFSNVLYFSDIQYSLNNSLRATWHFANNGWTIAVFDSVSGLPWETRINGSPGQASPYNNCLAFSDQTFWAFDFGSSTYCGSQPGWQTDFLNFMNSIPVNSHVLAYSDDVHGAFTYNASMYNAFASIGSSQIHNIHDSIPIIIFGKKGAAPGTAHEVVAANPQSVITLQDSITTKWNSGYIASELIGPAYKWNSLHWKYVSASPLVTDTVVIKVVGIRTSGQRDTVATFRKDSLDVYDLYNYANANTYPYIQLVALMKDNSFHYAPQFKKWQVLYDEAPECAINAKKGFVRINDTLQEGDNLVVHLPIDNIGVLPFTDSLVVTYWIEDKDRINHPLPDRLKAKPFQPAQVIMDTIRVNSFSYPGLNYLWVDVNPPGNARYQKEQYHFNNIARIPFSVNTDKINPLLDVTFDGTHILNGDIISTKPHVLVTLKDENKFLALNDTGDFVLYLKRPDDAQEKRIFFGGGLQFTPAHLPNNSCKIEWWPNFIKDGQYLFIVQAKDRSNNNSGAVDYRIQFDVVTKQTITEVLNYPNPFSTSTRFVFTLTGGDIPDVFTIQIMTISGKIVREITKEQLGYIHIGRNISQYAWDGRDEFGDKLGNGVYLYRVITRQNGQKIEHAATDADQFFKKDWGKMVIIR